MDMYRMADTLEEMMYSVRHTKFTEASIKLLLDLLDKQQKVYIPMSTGWILIESFKDYIKDRA